MRERQIFNPKQVEGQRCCQLRRRGLQEKRAWRMCGEEGGDKSGIQLECVELERSRVKMLNKQLKT